MDEYISNNPFFTLLFSLLKRAEGYLLIFTINPILRRITRYYTGAVNSLAQISSTKQIKVFSDIIPRKIGILIENLLKYKLPDLKGNRRVYKWLSHAQCEHQLSISIFPA
ncbi:hypothetical protein D6D85_01030 [Candidatus Methanodesulfokora washburnensis]|jgi:hypothetical protein|uniref:Uncharacterized protein n=1 Tax=Candidatus Methanodesulfokora washburnensis TaxID=2478471 RepID=A0A429GXB2_9CREN|nr:hypothetical protein D6D85_01030 [Candidatus Methanodesulfokores washburnensis]